jgi:hypothetical protein
MLESLVGQVKGQTIGVSVRKKGRMDIVALKKMKKKKRKKIDDDGDGDDDEDEKIGEKGRQAGWEE